MPRKIHRFDQPHPMPSPHSPFWKRSEVYLMVGMMTAISSGFLGEFTNESRNLFARLPELTGTPYPALWIGGGLMIGFLLCGLIARARMK